MLKKMRENKKGFTLVELIVVLVILAILAALLVPALTGYIDKAKTKSIIAETRSAVMAAQTLVDEAYGAKDIGGDVVVGDAAPADVLFSEIEDLADLEADTVSGVVVGTGEDAGVVQQLVYTSAGKVCTYNPANAANNSDGDYQVANQ